VYQPQKVVRLPRDEYRKLCLVVLNRDKYRCLICTTRNFLQVHHVIFRSHGGSDVLENLATVCYTCHVKIHHGDKRCKAILSQAMSAVLARLQQTAS